MSGISPLQIILTLFLILIILIVLILVVPSELSFLLAMEGLELETELNFGVLLGFLRGNVTSYPEGSLFELRLLAVPIIKRKQKKEDRERKAKPRVEMAIQEKIGLYRKLSDPFIRLLRAFLRHTRLKDLDCHIDLGLSDPVPTGMISGAVHTILGTISPFAPNASFTLTPVFTQEVFNATLRGSISLRIAHILIPVLRLFMKKEFRMISR